MGQAAQTGALRGVPWRPHLHGVGALGHVEFAREFADGVGLGFGFVVGHGGLVIGETGYSPALKGICFCLVFTFYLGFREFWENKPIGTK